MLAYAQQAWRDSIWRISLADEKRAAGPPALVVSEKGSKLRPHFSPDGKKIAFESDRLGSAEIWVCDSDGGNCGELTSLHGTAGTTAWSPDGRYLAFEFHPGEHAEIYIVELPAGIPWLLTTIPGADNLAPSWSRDGKWLYFTSKHGSGPFQLWKIALSGGRPVQITRNGGLDAVESSDDRFLYYSKYEAGGIWRMPLSSGAETRVLDRPSGPEWPNWALSKNGIYFIDDSESSASVEFFDFLTRKTTRISKLDKPTRWGLALAPDGRSLLYVDAEFEESSIMLVKNFR
jgi:Tol biopolymer transport system component